MSYSKHLNEKALERHRLCIDTVQKISFAKKKMVNFKISFKLTKWYPKILGHSFKCAFLFEDWRLFDKGIYDKNSDFFAEDCMLPTLEKAKTIIHHSVLELCVMSAVLKGIMHLNVRQMKRYIKTQRFH